MKKCTILFLFIFFCIASCKKANQADHAGNDKISLDEAVVIRKGNLISAYLPKVSGIVKIYQQKNGKYVLGLEQITLYSNVDLSAYLSAGPTLSSNSMKLFSFKNIDGQMYYELPSNITISSFTFLLIQGDISTLPAGIAELK